MEQSVLRGSEMPALVHDQQTRDIALAFKIEAASNRLMYALSMPEYIEAWLQAPAMEELIFLFKPITQDTFRLDLYRAEKLQTSISGSCRIVNTNQVRYTWRTVSSAGTSETLVDIWLRDSSGGCILGLKHSGFRDAVDSTWCSKMWNQSLRRLSRLMKKD